MSLLEQGVTELGLSWTDTQTQRINQYLELLKKWNKAYNLTSIEDDEQMITHHVLDSLVGVPYLPNDTLLSLKILDVGTGAGFPGIPLAIFFPQIQFVLLDSISKKTQFLFEVKHQLALSNVEVVQSRVENWRPAERFDVIMARALSRIQAIVESSSHLLKSNGYWLLWKGKYPEDELKELRATPEVFSVKVPGIDAERHLIKLGCGKEL